MLEHLCDLGNALHCKSAGAILIDATELVVVQAAKKIARLSGGADAFVQKASTWDELGT